MKKIIQFFKAVWLVWRLGPGNVIDLEKKVFLDFLTGLYNRRYLLDIGEREIERAKRYKHIFSIVFIDVNNFKKFNDQRGHREGDRMLKDIAASLKKICRKNDILARLGGDEFVVLLPETDEKSAETLVARIKERNSDPSVSCGIACWGSGSLEELINEADRRMYKDKKSFKKTA